MLRRWLAETRSLPLEALLQSSVRLLQAPLGAPHLRGLDCYSEQQQQQQQRRHVFWGLPRQLYRDDVLLTLPNGEKMKREEAKALKAGKSNSSSNGETASADDAASTREVMDEDGSPSKAKSNLGSSKCCYKLIGHEGRVLALTFAEAGDRCLLTGGSDAVIRLWPTPYSREVQQQGSAVSDSEGEEEEGVGRRRKQDPHLLPLCQYRGAAAPLWSLSASPLGQHPGAATDVPHVYMHPNSSLLLTAASDGVVRVFDLRAADAVRTWELPTAAGPLPSHLEGDRGSGAAAARAASAAVGAEISQVDGTLRWPLDPRLLSAAGRTALSSKSYHTSSLNGEASALTASPNGRLAAAADKMGHIYVWDIPSGCLISRAFAGLPAVHAAAAAAFAAEGCSSAAAAAAASETHATALSFCYNSSLLAGTTGDGRVLLWDTAAGRSPHMQHQSDL
ncbi:uncharacterized protein LOC34617498 [Cyclospora cayetanensis]|uniref:Uncharacterized protein LOC34617498 n=1 Tax=Cyclospora cayetanensis TaxID=88456 RepID=A0A6P6RVP5_9EIME|nr:uncharacterized protein LOC34617498 [Cyclospora cayetanensis]